MRWTVKRLVKELGAPKILVANTYFWSGFYGDAGARWKKSHEYATEVFNWLMDINMTLGLGLEIDFDEDNNVVQAFKDGEEVFYFSIWSSRQNVYKTQRVRGLLSLLNALEKQKAKEKKNAS